MNNSNSPLGESYKMGRVKDSFTGVMSKSPKYQDYYEYVQKNVNGKYEYVGPMFDFSEENDISYKRYITFMELFAVAMTVACVLSGLLRISGMNTAWQVIPYGLELLFVICTFWSVSKLLITKRPMKIFDFRATSEKIPKRSQPAMLASAVGLTAMVLYVFINGWNGQVINTLLYIAARGVVCFCSAMIYKISTVNVWKDVKNGTFDDEPVEGIKTEDPENEN